MEVAQLLETRYADCEQVTLVCDNLNTHTKGAFSEAFEPARARAYVKRIRFCYTPKPGRRIGALTERQMEIAAWSDKTNAKQRGVDWPFRIENARVKLKRLYPKIKT